MPNLGVPLIENKSDHIAEYPGNYPMSSKLSADLTTKKEFMSKQGRNFNRRMNSENETCRIDFGEVDPGHRHFSHLHWLCKSSHI